MKHDILKFTTNLTTLKIQANKVDGLKTKKIEKTAARVFKNGQIFSSAHIGTISDEALLAKAESAGNVGLEYEYALPNAAAVESLHFTNPSREQGIKQFTEFFEDLKKDFPEMNFSNGSIEFEKNSTRFSSNYTGAMVSGGDKVKWELLYKRYGITDFADGYLYFDGVHSNFDKIRRQVQPILEAVPKTASIESKKMPVMFFEPYDIGSRLSQDLRPERIHGGSSPLSTKVGEKVFSDQISFKDISYMPERGRFHRFDGEGVRHHNPVIFDKGVFSNVLYDLRQAHKANKQSTGNGRRDFNAGASFSFFELAMAPGQEDMWDLLKNVPECLVIHMGYGGGISPQWEYSSPVQVGYLVRHGQVVGRVPSVSVKGHLSEILGKDLIAVAKNGWCDSLVPAFLTQMEVLSH
jgi:PmbA protein